MADTEAPKGNSLASMAATLQAVAAAGLLGGKARNVILTAGAYDPLLRSITGKGVFEHVHGMLDKDNGHATLESIREALRTRKDILVSSLPENHQSFLSNLGAQISELFTRHKIQVEEVVEANPSLRAALAQAGSVANVAKAVITGKAQDVAGVTPPHEDSPGRPAAAQAQSV